MSIKIIVALAFVGVAIAAPALEGGLLPGALPETSSPKFAPFREIGGRIISGSPASTGQFPHQVALYISRSAGTSFCGGSLISSSWILTAAHCTQGATAITVYLGVISLSNTAGRVTATASRVINHAQYNGNTLVNDIAVIQLSSSVQTSNNVRIISLATATLGSGVTVTVSGWGRTSDSSTSISQTLNYVSLTTITNAQCSNTYGSASTGTGVVCATGSNIQSTCSGDSGGPLVTGSGTNVVQVGIVSYGHINGCALGHPNGFTRVAAYRSWISSNTGV